VFGRDLYQRLVRRLLAVVFVLMLIGCTVGNWLWLSQQAGV